MKKVKAFSLVLMLLFMGIGFVRTSQAKTKTSWSLRYVKGAPTSEYQERDDVWGKTRGKAIYMTVDSISGGAVVRLKIDQGATANGQVFSKKGKTFHANLPPNGQAHGYAIYETYGYETNYPKGRLVH